MSGVDPTKQPLLIQQAVKERRITLALGPFADVLVNLPNQFRHQFGNRCCRQKRPLQNGRQNRRTHTLATGIGQHHRPHVFSRMMQIKVVAPNKVRRDAASRRAEPSAGGKLLRQHVLLDAARNLELFF